MIAPIKPNHQVFQIRSEPNLHPHPNLLFHTFKSIMSCCNGKCGCGSSCSCGSGCNGCGMYPDIEASTTATMIIDGVTPKKMYDDGSDASFVSEGGHGCKCGANCKCDPCNC